MTGTRGRSDRRARRADGPQRTCVACRRVEPQPNLIRLTRTAVGTLEVDPARRAAGRGAYLCRRLACLNESVRRGRWAHLFRAPTTATPEVIERLRQLVDGDARSRAAAVPVEGRG